MSASAASLSGFPHLFEQGENPDAPTLLLLHGTGGNEGDLLPLGRTIAPGCSVLSPRGRVLENGASRYFRRIAEGVFDQADLAFRTTELNDFIRAASTGYSIDLTRLIAVGFSNGANMAASLFLRHPTTLGGALLLRAMVPFTPPKMPNLQRKPVLLLEGSVDPLVSSAEAENLEGLFEQANADVELHWVGGGHALSAEDVQISRSWFQRFYK